MVYVVKWTENGKKRELSVQFKPLAVVLLNRLIIDCKHYDAVLIAKKEFKWETIPSEDKQITRQSSPTV